MASLTPSAIELLSSADQELVAELVEECMIALEHGIPLDIESLVEAHPNLEEPLRRCLASLQTIHDAVHGMNDTLPSQPCFEVGGRLGDFQLESVIGRGGMGVVYLATQVSLDRKVAIKILPSNRFTSPKRLKRFLLEAQSAAQLQHPNIVPVFAVGEDSDVYYYAMQWIDGQSLDQCDTSDWSQNRFDRVAEAGFDIAMALQHAHDCGIIHRDIKPSNLLQDKLGKVWIADFGLAQRAQESSLTLSGELVGTANYMSPEQAAGRPVDVRTDIYSLGATLYEFATGHQAFRGNGLQEVLRKIERDDPIKPRKFAPELPSDLETIICKAMSKDREDRYASAQELALDLAAFRDGRTIQGRPPGIAKVLGKQLVRHLPLFGVGLAGVVLCLVVMLAGMIQVWNERNATNLALQQSQENLRTSQENYWRGRNVLDRWNKKWLPQLAHIPEALPIRSAMLADTIEYYEGYLEKLDKAADDTLLSSDRDAARLRLAEAYVQSGDTDRAVANYASAIADMQDHFAVLDSENRRNLFVAYNDLGLVYLSRGNTKVAESQLSQSIHGHDQLCREDPSREESLADKAAAHLNLAQTYHAMGAQESESKHRSAAEKIYRELTKRNPDSVATRSELGVLLDHRAVSLSTTEIDQAIRVATEAAQWHRSCVSDDKKQVLECQRLGASLHNLGVLQSQAELLDPCRTNLSEAIAVRSKLVSVDPKRIQHQVDLASSYSAIGAIESKQAHWTEAKSQFQLASEILQNCFDQNRSVAGSGIRLELARALLNLAKVERDQNSTAPTILLGRIDLLLDELKQSQLNPSDIRIVDVLFQELRALRETDREVQS